MSTFYVRAVVATYLEKECGFKRNKFTPAIKVGYMYGINFQKKQLHVITRSDKPKKRLSLSQVQELLITPVEAHSELLKHM